MASRCCLGILFFIAVRCNTTTSKISFQKEEYRSKYEAIVYVFRERAFVGGGVQTVVFFDEKSVGLLPQKGYFPIHTTAGAHRLKICSGNIIASNQCQEKQLNLDAHQHVVIAPIMHAGNDFHFAEDPNFDKLFALKNEGNYFDAMLRELAPQSVRRVTLSAGALAEGKAERSPLKVAILNFSDQTKSDTCGWLSGSLPDAIDQSMRRDFEYLRPNAASTQKIADRSAGKTDAERAKEIGTNLVISGQYILHENKSTVRIEAQIYFADSDKVLGTEFIDAPLDGEIFAATKKLSDKIVAKLHQLVRK